jgi:anti-sigma regulatory factor (Ser/Thr protein kinase)
VSGFNPLIARRLRVTSGPGALKRLRREVRVALLRDVASLEACELAMLAVEEAAANIFEHGYSNRPGCSLEIMVRPGEQERFAIVLRDRAPVFDVTTLAPVDLDRLAREFATRGRGLAIVRQIADSVRHRPRRGGGNELTLIFNAERLSGGVENLREEAA